MDEGKIIKEDKMPEMETQNPPTELARGQEIFNPEAVFDLSARLMVEVENTADAFGERVKKDQENDMAPPESKQLGDEMLLTKKEATGFMDDFYKKISQVSELIGDKLADYHAKRFAKLITNAHDIPACIEKNRKYINSTFLGALLENSGIDGAKIIFNYGVNLRINLDESLIDLLLNKLGEKGADVFSANLWRFHSLSKDVADKIIDRFGSKGASDVVRFAGKFNFSLDSNFANELIQKLNKDGANLVISRFGQFRSLDSSVADGIIGKLGMDGYRAIRDNIFYFDELDNNIAYELIDRYGHDGAAIVIRNSNKFNIKLDVALAARLAAEYSGGGIGALADNIAYFNVLNSDIARQLISRLDQIGARAVAENLAHFESLDASIAYRLIQQPDYGINYPEIIKKVTDNLSHFESLDAVIAAKIIDELNFDGVSAVAENVSRFGSLNPEIANSVIHRLGEDGARLVADNANKFGVLGNQKFIEKLAAQNFFFDGLKMVIENAEKLGVTLDPEQAFEFIRMNPQNGFDAVIENHEKFGITLDENFASQLMAEFGSNGAAAVITKADKFGITLDAVFAQKTIDQLGKDGIRLVANLLHLFKSLDSGFAKILISNLGFQGCGAVAGNLNCFDRLDSDIGQLLISKLGRDGLKTVVENNEIFGVSLDVNFIQEILKSNYSAGTKVVIENSDKFGITLNPDFANKLIELDNYNGTKAVIENADKFGITPDAAFANQLLSSGVRYIMIAMVENIADFKSLDVAVANKILDNFDNRGVNDVTENLDSFGQLDNDLAWRIFKRGGTKSFKIVLENPGKFGLTLDSAAADQIMWLSDYRGAQIVIENADKFGITLNPEYANVLIGKSQPEIAKAVLENADKFGIILDSDFASQLMERFGDFGAEVIGFNLALFKSLNKNIATKIMTARPVDGAALVGINLDSFASVDRAIADEMMKLTYVGVSKVVSNADKFGITLDIAYADQLIDQFGYEGAKAVITYHNKFGITLDSILADQLIEKLGKNGALLVADNAQKFKEKKLDGNIANKLIDFLGETGARTVTNNVACFELLDRDVANKIVTNMHYDGVMAVVGNPDKFLVTLDAAYANQLIEQLGYDGARLVIEKNITFGVVLNRNFADQLVEKLGYEGARAVVDYVGFFEGDVEGSYFTKVMLMKSPKDKTADLFNSHYQNLGGDLSANSLNLIIEMEQAEPERRELAREAQIITGAIFADKISVGDYEYFDKISEPVAHGQKHSEYFKSIVEKFVVGNKGKTLLVLCAANACEDGVSPGEIVSLAREQMERMERVIDRFADFDIPDGLKASVGMEYEITKIIDRNYQRVFDANLKRDIVFLSEKAGVGQGRDAIHEIATTPTDNPAVLLAEMKLLQDLGFIDFNFRDTAGAGRGYHLTVGGEAGIRQGQNVDFALNCLNMAGWAGINAGADVNSVSSGRSESTRQRNGYTGGVLFKNLTPSVELRSLSIDAWEPFERVVEVSYFAGVAIQALEKCGIRAKDLSGLVTAVIGWGQTDFEAGDFLESLRAVKDAMNDGLMNNNADERAQMIAAVWIKLIHGMTTAIDRHNEDFFGENYSASAYQRAKGDRGDQEFFDSKLKLDSDSLFHELTPDVPNRLSAVANLFLKPPIINQGDQANLGGVLGVTKIGESVEDSHRTQNNSMFDDRTEPRRGYYYYQGGSPEMIIHKSQQLLLDFIQEMTAILSKPQAERQAKAA